jgi:hypothetical protein
MQEGEDHEQAEGLRAEGPKALRGRFEDAADRRTDVHSAEARRTDPHSAEARRTNIHAAADRRRRTNRIHEGDARMSGHGYGG